MTPSIVHTLTARDRCDGCGQQAYYSVGFLAGDLLFCRRCFLRHEHVLRDVSLGVTDESDKLVKRNTTGVGADG